MIQVEIFSFLFLKKTCEIEHFHPWLTPPEQEFTAGHNYVSNDYSDDILKLKFDKLHNAIIDRFGVAQNPLEQEDGL